MIKPFDSNELVARVKAVLRRTVMTQAVTTAAPVSIAEVTDHQGEFVEYDGLLINMTNYTVTLDGESVEMPPKELELLYHLAATPNRVYTATSFGRGVGIRLFWRQPYRGCAYQPAERPVPGYSLFSDPDRKGLGYKGMITK